MGRISALTELTSLASNDYFIVLDSSANIAKKISVANAFGVPEATWTSTGETWTFSSFNSTSGIGVVTVPTDATTKYTTGMWVRFSQTTGGTKYAKITAVTATTLSLQFGASITLNNETITSPVYSPLARPYGVPAEANPKSGTISGAGVLNTTGNKTITGLGFKPRIVRFTSMVATGTSMNLGVGSMDSSGNQFSSTGSHSNAGTSSARTSVTNRALVVQSSGSTAVAMDFSYVSMNADGFTINVATAGGIDVGYEAYP